LNGYVQIGQSKEDQIDCIVMDTIPEAKSFKDLNIFQSTISRYAYRIIVSRHPPYTARIYAVGFDCSKNICLEVKKQN
jgi:pellino protein